LTTVELSPDLLRASVVEAAGTLALKLPITGSAGEPLDTADVSTLVPGAGARAVTAGVVGTSRATVVLALSAEAAAALEDGPLGPQDLAAVVETHLLDALGALEASLGGPLVLEAAQALDAELAVTTLIDSAAQANHPMVAVPIRDGDRHVATIALAMTGGLDESSSDAHAQALELADLDAAPGMASSPNVPSALELLADVEMSVTAELGRTRMTVRDLLGLQTGAVVELDRVAGSPIDLLVNGTLVARGEIVVIDEEYGVRISEIVDRDQTRRR
jgi:flagellar motor switch protein FliN